MSDSAAGGSATCPQCGTDNIEFDPVQVRSGGIKACECVERWS